MSTSVRGSRSNDTTSTRANPVTSRLFTSNKRSPILSLPSMNAGVPVWGCGVGGGTLVAHVQYVQYMRQVIVMIPA